MPDYFKLWRRKIGVLTLVVACVFAAGWVRSFSKTDIVTVHGTYAFISENGRFTISQRLRVRQKFKSGATKGDSISSLSFNSWISPWSFDVGSTSVLPDYTSLTPYWSIVIPLTLLSAWLLLSKTRVAE
jgi:hypothetical protein